ncbi:MAG: transcription termination/antitermination protein NusA [Parcubacteria group bacterium]|nr:transcription termination/antitermination protein NusA [Parcubacteria group bacterium]
MFDLKIINSVLDQLEDERGIPREKVIDAIETSLATAYKREYGKRGQIIRAKFDIATGSVEFFQVKIVVDESLVKTEEELAKDVLGKDAKDDAVEDDRARFNPEHHIMINDARLIKKDAELDNEVTFPLETKDDFGRIAAQTAKQVIIQKIREAEKVAILDEYGQREGDIVNGTVQRIERGNIFIELGRTTGILPYDEQIPGERYRQGERIRALLYSVEESHRGTFLRLSRSNPDFLKKLFEMETPELASGSVEIKEIAREAGSRSKIAVISHDEHIDPVGSLVGQRGVRVSTVMSELGGEKIDIIEWSEDPKQFVEDALSPAKVVGVDIKEGENRAVVEVAEDQQSLAIGKGGQNVRLAAKLTGLKIDIQSMRGENIEETEKNTKDGKVVDEIPKEEVGAKKEASAEAVADDSTKGISSKDTKQEIPKVEDKEEEGKKEDK